METKIRFGLLFFCGLSFLSSCSPDEEKLYDNNNVDVRNIHEIQLIPNHKLLIADGKAEIDLRPLLFSEEGNLVPDERVNEQWLEYVSEEGVPVKRHFSTSDLSLVGTELNVRAKIKGTDIVSNAVTFKLVEPLQQEHTSEIVIPVVLHLIQTTEEIEKYQGKFDKDRAGLILKKLNNVFSGNVSNNPVGVDTHIRFALAHYDPFGKKMPEYGINRVVEKEIPAENNFKDFLLQKHLNWPVDKYMNIWLISDKESKVQDFGYEISDKCMPRYVNAGVITEAMPDGLKDLEPYSDEKQFGIEESGIIYKLQELDELDRSFGAKVNNELVYYVGRYLGLYPTCTYVEGFSDYCDDTIEYYETEESDNDRSYKTMDGCYFWAENIMDDPRGVHCSVSKDQCIRMRWVLNNCPERSSWKNNFALNGNK